MATSSIGSRHYPGQTLPLVGRGLFNKCRKVIESCTTTDQLIVAMRYLNLASSYITGCDELYELYREKAHQFPVNKQVVLWDEVLR